MVHELAPDAGVQFADGTYVARLPLQPDESGGEPEVAGCP